MAKMEGIITKIVSNAYTVQIKNKCYVCKARGKFRYLKDSPVVGDKVVIDEDKALITEILPRLNKLDRPPVANIYYAIIVASLKKPALDLYLLDKMLATMEKKCQNIIILFTKLDLCNETEQKKAQEIFNYYQSLNYLVYFNKTLDWPNLKQLLQGNVITLMGQSGAGKSTFLNKLSPALDLKTHPISEALNRGVHTTRHCEIYDIEGIFFVDTPGFSALDLKMTLEDLKASFRDLANVKCKYQDCNHDKEEGCLVKEMVDTGDILKSRYQNYILFKKEIYENSRKLYK